MSITVTTPEDLVPLQAQLTDHEARLQALEAGGGPGPGPSPSDALVIGMWYAEMGRFPDTAAWGFNGVHEWCYPDNGSMGYLDAAHAHGLSVALELSWAMDDGIGVGKFFPDRLNQIMLPAYINHPALKWWVAWDEPDLRGTPVAEMQKFYDAIAAKDPNHPTICTIRYPFRSSGQPYNKFPKILGVDPYMINYGPAEQCGDETAQTVAVAGGKVVLTDVQTFSWANTFSPPGRIPTIQEVEVMGQTSLDAMTHAEKHLWCYLEDELVADAGLRNGIDETVTRWKASQGVATLGVTRKAAPRGPWKPLPKHPAIDAAKLAMKVWKRRNYPRPA